MTIRILGLGNDLLADDRFGLVAAQELGRRVGTGVDVRLSGTAGFDLLEDTLGATRMLVLDTIETGAAPGTVFEVREQDLEAAVSALGNGPHSVGLFEALHLGRGVGLPVPSDVVILAVEPEDTLTVGGDMSSRVRAALDDVLDRGERIIERWRAESKAAAEPVRHPRPSAAHPAPRLV